MTRYSTLADPTLVKRYKTARRVSIFIGVTLAVAVAASMYVVLFRQQAPAAQHVAARRAIIVRQLAGFAVIGVPDSVQLDPNGKIVVAVTGYSRVSAWSTSNGRPLSGFAAVPDSTSAGSRTLSSPTFSPGGKKFTVTDDTGSSGAVAYVWNVATGQTTSVSGGYPVPGPAGLSAGSDSYPDGAVDLAATATGQPHATILVHRTAGSPYQLSEPVFSPDGRTIAVGDDLGKIYLLNVPGKRIGVTLTAEKIYNTQYNLNGMVSMDIDSITFSPDSRRVACGSESGIIHVWDTATGRNVSAFNVNGGTHGHAAARPVKTLVFSPDGKMLVTADNADNTLAVWDVASGRPVATLTAGTGTVASAAFLTNGTLIAATTQNSASGHKIEIWATAQSLVRSVPSNH